MVIFVSLALWSAITTFHLSWAYSPLRLSVDPSFLQVKEDWKVATPLEVSICASDAHNQSSLTISNGDPIGYFRLKTFNTSCWSLSLKRELDADQQNAQGTRGQTFSLTFQLSAGRQQSKGNLVIQVIDINDNAPRFVDTPGDVSISETAAPGTLIATLTTFDPDIGVGGINTFRLEDNPERKFRLGSGDGACSNSKCTIQLFLDGTLDYATRNTYKLVIVAVDGAGRTLRVNPTKFTLVVNVIDVQNSPPRFITDGRPQKVPENVALGTQVFQVLAQDGDTGADRQNAIRYRVVGEKRFFDIHAESGWVFVIKPLDRESAFLGELNGAVNLTIEAEEATGSADEKPLTSRLDITVLITDVDDESPQCNQSSYTVQVAENSAAHQPAAVVDAADILAFDLDQASFSVSLSGKDAVWFEVYPKSVTKESTIQLRVSDGDGLDYEQSPTLNFDIILTPTTENAKIKSGRCAIKVNILDVNDNAPQFNQSELVGSVLENEPEGTIVMNVTATDADSDRFGPILYTITGSGAGNFKVGNDGSIATTRPLDREKTAQYQLTLTAIDSAGKGNRETIPLTISVDDVNDNAPLFDQAVYTAYLLEGASTFMQYPKGYSVKATDLDESETENARVSYYFVNDTSLASVNFSIDSTTGIIQPIGNVDLESMVGNVVNLTIGARDHGDPSQSSTAILIVYVNDTNDNSPVFDQSSYNVTIDEDIKPLTAILNVTASDADRSERNRLLTYRIDDAQDRFIIDSRTGVLSVGKRSSLDLPANPVQYELRVIVVDNGSPQKSATATVFINVNDINDKPPKFSEPIYYARVSEKATAFTSLLNLTANDPDETAIMHYNISGFSSAKTVDGRNVDDSADPYDYARRFAIRPHNGELFLRDTVDRERLESVVIHITAMDINGEVNTPQTGDTHNSYLLLFVPGTTTKLTLSENDVAGAQVAVFSATDRDESDGGNGKIRYFIVNGNSTVAGKPMFALDPESGTLSLVDDLRGRYGLYDVVIEARDSGIPQSLSANLSILIAVRDFNDHRPTIYNPAHQSIHLVNENTERGNSSIVQVKAMDLDEGDNAQLQYSFKNTAANEDWRYFLIDESTGYVWANVTFDYETKSRYVLIVAACDQGKPPQCSEVEFTVAVQDENDECPYFDLDSKYVHHLTIPENQPVTAESGVPVGQFPAALDDDGGEDNRQTCYRIEQTSTGRTGPFFLKSADSRVLMTNEGSNPVWMSAYETYGVGRDNYGLDFDLRSENSLDRNALAKSGTPRSSSSAFVGGKNHFGAMRFNGDVRRPSSTPRMAEPEPDYPRELLAALESTEL
uniref:Cadherin domain-containing protein n=1 Tax=Plectus sambesii TaxID=2011161 RepID=A0A914UJ66_9BILA